MHITDIHSNLRTITISNEVYFNCNDFFELLKTENDIRFIDCIITPFYISNNKRYELYEYELIMSSTESFQQYMTIVAGRQYESINNNVLEIRRNCYIELSDRINSDITADVIKYIEYLMDNIKLKNEVKDIFDEYDASKIFLQSIIENKVKRL